MRILHVTTFLQGGAGRVIVELAREQQRTGHDVTVVASRRAVPGYGNYQEYVDDLAALGIPLHLVDSTFERTHALNVAAATALAALVPPGDEPDVIHTHAAIPSMAALLLAGARRTPVALLQTMHGWGRAKTADQVTTDVGLLNLVDRVVVPSTHSARLLAALGVAPSRIGVVPYGVRSAPMPPGAADRALLAEMADARRRGVLVIVCVGTLGVRKNQELLVEAIARRPDVETLCVFVGDGDDRPLREAIALRGCGARVRLHGYSRGARAIAASADLLVLPSRSEGQPVSVLEAFCDGTLVAVSDIAELVELVDDGATGFTFRSEDAAALAGTIARVAALPEPARQSVRDAARAQYAAHFTLARMTGRYAAEYETILGRLAEPVTRRAAWPAA